jgi:hypothetical protein
MLLPENQVFGVTIIAHGLTRFNCWIVLAEGTRPYLPEATTDWSASASAPDVPSVEDVEASRYLSFTDRAHRLDERKGLSENLHVREKDARGITKSLFIVKLPAVTDGKLLTHCLSVKYLIHMLHQ